MNYPSDYSVLSMIQIGSSGDPQCSCVTTANEYEDIPWSVVRYSNFEGYTSVVCVEYDIISRNKSCISNLAKSVSDIQFRGGVVETEVKIILAFQGFFESSSVRGMYFRMKISPEDPEWYIQQILLSFHSLKESKQLFLKYKSSILANELASLKVEVKETSRRIELLKKEYGIPENSISDIYPHHQHNVKFMFELEDIISSTASSGSISTIEFYDSLYSPGCLMDLIGQKPEKVRVLQNILTFSRCWKIQQQSFMNYCILGESGIGKTSFAYAISRLYYSVGLLNTKVTKVTSRANFVAGYVGQTAIKTKSILQSAIEGVIFVDEAYSLQVGDYGNEAITEILAFSDKFKHNCAIIIAGYEDKMKDQFFKSNEGLERRFPNVLYMKPYSDDDITLIINKKLYQFGLVATNDLVKDYQFPKHASSAESVATEIVRRFLLFGELANSVSTS